MKRAFRLLLIASWAALGCESLPRLWEEPKSNPAPVAAPVANRPRRTLSAEQVTDSNAHDAAEAMMREIDRDANGDPLPPRVK